MRPHHTSVERTPQSTVGIAPGRHSARPRSAVFSGWHSAGWHLGTHPVRIRVSISVRATRYGTADLPFILMIHHLKL